MLYKQNHQTDNWDDIDEIISNSEKNLKQLKKIDKKQPVGSILYRYFVVPVADDYAYYQIVKVNDSICVVRLCNGICLDNYKDNVLGDEATITVTTATSEVNRRVALEKLFSKN